MPFEPDIVVETPELHRFALVVEVKEEVSNLPQIESQIKHYMTSMRCPVGIIITPTKIWLYRDSYADYSVRSVRKIGEFEMPDLQSHIHAQAGHLKDKSIALEAAAQAWLERLLIPANLAAVPEKLRKVLSDYVVPALQQGELRAAGPRRQAKATR